jgi:hypothetical protein
MSRLVLCLFLVLPACAAKAPPPSGFLSDYARLEKVDQSRLRYVSDDLAAYDAYLIDPVAIRVLNAGLSDAERSEISRHFHDTLVRILTAHGHMVAEAPGPRVARVRVALAGATETVWIFNLHPAMKLSGIGAGGAAIEGEILDSVTGEQLAAWIHAGRGSQFELDTFDSIDDIKDVITRWTEEAVTRLDELHADSAAIGADGG